ncbi:MAG: Kelch repeat-containing protein, partial [Kiritimatiellia bacterium]
LAESGGRNVKTWVTMYRFRYVFVLVLAVLYLWSLATHSLELPINKWVVVNRDSQPGYVWSALVYVPTREQILHWGAEEGNKSRNDVRAFDVKTGRWLSDYPSDPPTAATGTSYGGVGTMLPSGRPQPYYVIQGVCWDSRRQQLVYTMKGLMAAYNPSAKTWTNLHARTSMPYPVCYYSGKEVTIGTGFPGGPPIYGIGTCYDPENDEIILFPHFDAKNVTLRDVTGQITGHYGTFRYSFADSTWRCVSSELGNDSQVKTRLALLGVMGKTSAAMDVLWVLRRRPDRNHAEATARRLSEAATELERMPLGTQIKNSLAPVLPLLKTAASFVTEGRLEQGMKAGCSALWVMNEVLARLLCVEPPPRTAARMVYDARNKAIVLFGGQTNLCRSDIGEGLKYSGLNDTWLYDVRSRQWREIARDRRPPRTRIPVLDYDPQSGLVLLVTLEGRPPRAALWTLDISREEWSKRYEQEFPGTVATRSGQGSESPKAHMPAYMGAFDAKSRLFIIVQPEKEGQVTYAMKIDLSQLPAEPAPLFEPEPPIKPFQTDVADDPTWVAGLAELPANTWVQAKPPKEPARRDWGIISVDPVRGWVAYFGGGHSTHQCNDVAVYWTGANRWENTAGEHNGHIPNNEWEGSTLGHRGGPATGHQRNTYQTFDGRMFLFYGTADRPSNYVFHADPDYARLYDFDRGGVWREIKIEKAERPARSPAGCHVSVTDPKGRLFTLLGEAPYYYAPNFVRYFVSCLDLNENALTLKEVPKPFPEQRGLGEGRPFCYLSDQNQILLMNAKPVDPAKNYSDDPKKCPLRQITFLYDVASNSFRELPARRTPPVHAVQVVEYCEAQKCLLAIVGNQQWVYSFEKQTWSEMPLVTDGGKMSFQAPYGQMVWVAKYGVFVNFDGRTWILRPEFGQLKFD